MFFKREVPTDLFAREVLAMMNAELLKSEQFHDLAAHFLALNASDRYLRFGWVISDDDLVKFVENCARMPDDVFVVADPAPDICGALRMDFAGGFAEIGLSVSSWARGKGVGSSLLKRAALHASVRGVRTLFVYNLSANAALRRLALRLGMQVASTPAATTTRLEMPPRDEYAPEPDRCAASMTLADYSLRFLWNASLRPPALLAAEALIQ
jgi:RimJ/RimL family protein N-acetyltransferase